MTGPIIFCEKDNCWAIEKVHFHQAGRGYTNRKLKEASIDLRSVISYRGMSGTIAGQKSKGKAQSCGIASGDGFLID